MARLSASHCSPTTAPSPWQSRWPPSSCLLLPREVCGLQEADRPVRFLAVGPTAGSVRTVRLQADGSDGSVRVQSPWHATHTLKTKKVNKKENTNHKQKQTNKKNKKQTNKKNKPKKQTQNTNIEMACAAVVIIWKAQTETPPTSHNHNSAKQTRLRCEQQSEWSCFLRSLGLHSPLYCT